MPPRPPTLRALTLLALTPLALTLWSVTATATATATATTTATATPEPSALCRAAIARAEAAHQVPQAFLAAIARVESGRPDPASGALSPWPWTINAEGQGSFYPTKTQAIEAVRALQARGVRSIDVGCLQVNLLQHPDAFASLDQAFDPDANAAFAGGFLVSLFGQTGSWPRAAAAYHSQTPNLGHPYQQRVLAEWAEPEDPKPGQPPRGVHKSASASATQSAPAIATALPPGTQPAGGGAPTLAAFGTTGPIGPGPAKGGIPPRGGPNGISGRNLASYRLIPTRLAFRAPTSLALRTPTSLAPRAQ